MDENTSEIKNLVDVSLSDMKSKVEQTVKNIN